MFVFWTVVLSFFLESITSNFVPIHTTLLLPLFTLVSLIIIYPYFNHHDEDYLKVAGLLGLCYDLVFTDTVFFHALLFLAIACSIRFLNEWFSTNLFSIGFMSAIIIFLYRTLEYGVLTMIGFLNFDGMYLLKGITSSLLLNIIYAILLYLITDWCSKKFHIRKID